MKQLLAGFIDVWNVVVIDSFRRGGDPIVTLFDVGVFIGVVSMLALILAVCAGIAIIF